MEETGVSKKSIKSDLARIQRMEDSEIDYPDIPALDKSFLKKATTAWPPVKQQLTIRLDADVLAWLKAHGREYQTRIDRILRVVMESHSPARPGEKPACLLPAQRTRKLQNMLGDRSRPVNGRHHNAAGFPGGLDRQIARANDPLPEGLVEPDILHLGQLHNARGLRK